MTQACLIVDALGPDAGPDTAATADQNGSAEAEPGPKRSRWLAVDAEEAAEREAAKQLQLEVGSSLLNSLQLHDAWQQLSRIP